VAFLEWLDPPFNGGHWNPELVELAGGIDVLGNPATPSVTLEWQQVADSRPDVLFIACCGFSIDRARDDIQRLSAFTSWTQMPAVSSGNVFLTDGSAYFSRPGPRLLDGLEIMANALHPEVHPQSPYGLCWRISDYAAPCASGVRTQFGE
jgi:iron complex transport system substrate-binding protein